MRGLTYGRALHGSDDARSLSRFTVAAAGAAGMLFLLYSASSVMAQSAQTADKVALTLTAVTRSADAELIYSLASGPGGVPVNVSVATQSGTGTRTFRVSHNGSLHIAQSEAANLKVENIECKGAVSNVDLASRKVVLAITSDDAVSCTFTSSSVDRTAALTQQTLQRTATSLTNGLPSTSNRVTERLSASMGIRKIAVPQSAENQSRQTQTAALIPLTGSGDDDAGSAKFSTAFSDIAEAKAREQAELVRNSGVQLPGITVARSRFDGWVEGNIGYASNDENNTSDAFSNLAIGADYRLNESWLVGVMGNYSTIASNTVATAPDIAGNGWMVGPYAGYKINKQMFLSMKALHGVGETQYYGTAESPLDADGLETTRWLFDATLTGNWKAGNWTLAPSAQFMHFTEHGSQTAHDSSGSAVGASADTGRFLFGPQISYEFAPTKTTRITPRAAVKGLWEMEEVTIDDEAVADLSNQGLSTRLEAGIAVTSSKAKLDFSGSLEGFGAEADKAASGKATLSVPLN